MVLLKDLAAACNMSVATVSKALNDRYDVSQATKERVWEVARKMGYVSSGSNDNNKEKKQETSRRIGIILGKPGPDLSHVSYHALIVQKFCTMMEKDGYEIVIIGEDTFGKGSFTDFCEARQLDGVLLAEGLLTEQNIKDLVNAGFPALSIDHVYEGLSAVCADHEDGMRQILMYACSRGHRRVAFVHGSKGEETQQRLRAFHQTLQELELSVPEEYIQAAGYADAGAAKEATAKILDLQEPPSCILYSDDVCCSAGVFEIAKRGLYIGRNISVIGYDGPFPYPVAGTYMATFRHNLRDMGEMAAHQMLRMIEKPKTTSAEVFNIRGKLITGESVARL